MKTLLWAAVSLAIVIYIGGIMGMNLDSTYALNWTNWQFRRLRGFNFLWENVYKICSISQSNYVYFCIRQSDCSAVVILTDIGGVQVSTGILLIRDQGIAGGKLYFGNLELASLSLLQVITFDGWSSVVDPSVRDQGALMLFFLLVFYSILFYSILCHWGTKHHIIVVFST
jgi:hypothetical protein